MNTGQTGSPSQPQDYRVREEDLPEGGTAKIRYREKGRWKEAFVARRNGRLLGYENACRHMPLTLDYDDNRFFTRDGRHFICQTHGALYDPETGECVEGPCIGLRLHPVTLKVEDGWISVQV